MERRVDVVIVRYGIVGLASQNQAGEVVIRLRGSLLGRRREGAYDDRVTLPR